MDRPVEFCQIGDHDWHGVHIYLAMTEDVAAFVREMRGEVSFITCAWPETGTRSTSKRNAAHLPIRQAVAFLAKCAAAEDEPEPDEEEEEEPDGEQDDEEPVEKDDEVDAIFPENYRTAYIFRVDGSISMAREGIILLAGIEANPPSAKQKSQGRRRPNVEAHCPAAREWEEVLRILEKRASTLPQGRAKRGRMTGLVLFDIVNNAQPTSATICS